MKITKDESNGVSYALVESEKKLLTSAEEALEILMTARFETGTKNLIFSKKTICEDFFILSTGLAGEVLQKIVNYDGRIAIYGDFSRYTSKPLRDFMLESNQGDTVFFTATLQEAVDRLCRTRTKG